MPISGEDSEHSSQPGLPIFSTVLFDLDGTLLDSEQINTCVVERMYKETLQRTPDPDDLNRYRTLSTEAILQEIAPESAEHLLTIWPQYFHEYKHLLSLYPGIPELLAVLKELKVKMGVVTLQNRNEVAATRKLVDFKDWIDTWVAVDEVEHPKPHPAPVLEALRRLNTEPQEAIIIGDSVTDLMAGKQAGVRTGAALWGCFQPDALLQQDPDFIFKKPEEVTRLCLKRIKTR